MSEQIRQQDRLEASPPQESRSETPRRRSIQFPSRPPLPRGALPQRAELVQARQDHADCRGALEGAGRAIEDDCFRTAGLKSAERGSDRFTRTTGEKLKEAEQVASPGERRPPGNSRGTLQRRVTIAAQDLEMQNLSEKLTEQTEILERERTLLAAGRDIHDLMGARNLHIADVFDVDSKGKDQRAFGRVFYTEEKSLIFYAFDLGDRNTAKRNASFQVWGTRGPAQNPAQSLGIFYVDDQKQNRWLLKFEDPRILAQIDSVFVTSNRRAEVPGPRAANSFTHTSTRIPIIPAACDFVLNEAPASPSRIVGPPTVALVQNGNSGGILCCNRYKILEVEPNDA